MVITTVYEGEGAESVWRWKSSPVGRKCQVDEAGGRNDTKSQQLTYTELHILTY